MTRRQAIDILYLAAFLAFLTLGWLAPSAHGQTTKKSVTTIGSIRSDAADTEYVLSGSCTLESGKVCNWKNVTLRGADPTKPPTITVAKGDALFLTGNARNVTIRDVKIEALDGHAIVTYGSDTVTIQSVQLGRCDDGVHIIDSRNVTINGLKQTVETKQYSIYAGISSPTKSNANLRISNCDLTKGSRDQSVMRFQAVNGLTIESVKASEFGPVKKASCRVHFSTAVTINNFTGVGDLFVGPLDGNDGGRRETDPAKRAYMLGWRLDGFVMTNWKLDGELQLRPGLINADIGYGETTRNVSIRSNYPEAEFLKPGDVKRPAPQGVLHDLKITNPEPKMPAGGKMKVWNIVLRKAA